MQRYELSEPQEVLVANIKTRYKYDVRPRVASAGGNREHIKLQGQTVNDYAVGFLQGDVFPPVTLDAEMYIVDGQHRVAAARKAGVESIKARFITADKEQALIYAIGENSKHGRAYKKAHRVALALEMSEMGMDTEAIGNVLRVSRQTAGTYIKNDRRKKILQWLRQGKPTPKSTFAHSIGTTGAYVERVLREAGEQAVKKEVGEYALQKECLNILFALDGTVIKGSKMREPGTPDLLVMFANGSVHWVELKTPNGKLQPQQIQWQKKYNHEPALITSAEEFKAFCKEKGAAHVLHSG